MFNSYTAFILCLAVFGGVFLLGFMGVGSDTIPDDMSVRVESAAGTSRTHRGGGLRRGK